MFGGSRISGIVGRLVCAHCGHAALVEFGAVERCPVCRLPGVARPFGVTTCRASSRGSTSAIVKPGQIVNMPGSCGWSLSRKLGCPPSWMIASVDMSGVAPSSVPPRRSSESPPAWSRRIVCRPRYKTLRDHGKRSCLGAGRRPIDPRNYPSTRITAFRGNGLTRSKLPVSGP
jgi:hypothetical protein